jgi:hypothetical protein
LLFGVSEEKPTATTMKGTKSDNVTIHVLLADP